jgi:CxxC motif-containing protein
MLKKNEIICTVCPMACGITVTIDDAGDVIEVAGNQCKEGKKYATDECKFPGRVLTTTILTEGSSYRLLPVRSAGRIPKDRLMDSARFLAGVRVKPPVKMEQVIIPNILDTGTDMISTEELLS